jgi:hypothetical protein
VEMSEACLNCRDGSYSRLEKVFKHLRHRLNFGPIKRVVGSASALVPA